MSASPGKWETVVNKKKSQVSKSDVKRAQQKFLDNAGNSKVDAKSEYEVSVDVRLAISRTKHSHFVLSQTSHAHRLQEYQGEIAML